VQHHLRFRVQAQPDRVIGQLACRPQQVLRPLLPRRPSRRDHLPGVRAYACGKPNCRCHADPPRLHGPYAEWTRKISGKTITRRLTPAELAEYQPLFDNAKKLRALLGELQDLTLDIVAADSNQPPQSAEPEARGPESVG
jgi:hypothetical protein